MFYVYTYNHPVNGYPIYVGKGHGFRYKQHLNKSSNKNLKRFIENHDKGEIEKNIQIVFESTNESLVLEVEKHLISSYGLFKDGGLLFNLLRSGSSNTQISLPEWVIPYLGKVPDRVVEEMCGVNWSTVRDKRRALKIPSLKEAKAGTKDYSQYFDNKDCKKYLLYDTNGRSFHGTRKELCENLGLCNMELGCVLRGSKSHTKGYFSKPTDRVTPYTYFKFEKDDEVFIGTYGEFSNTYNMIPRSVRNACTKHRKDIFGWVITRIRYE